MEDITDEYEMNQNHPDKSIDKINQSIGYYEDKIETFNYEKKQLEKQLKVLELYEILKKYSEVVYITTKDELSAKYWWINCTVKTGVFIMKGYTLCTSNKTENFGNLSSDDIDIDVPNRESITSECEDELNFNLNSSLYHINDKVFNPDIDSIEYNDEDIDYGDWDDGVSVKGHVDLYVFHIKFEDN